MTGFHPAQRFFLTSAAVVVVIFGMREISSVVLPVLMAGLLALLCVPPQKKLESWGVPSGLAIVLVLSLAMAGLTLLGVMIKVSAEEFTSEIPSYESSLNYYWGELSTFLKKVGISLSDTHIDSDRIISFATASAGKVASGLGNLIFVALTMIFILTEAHGFPAKLREISAGEGTANVSKWKEALDRVQDYVAIKAALSALTGLLVWLMCVILGVDLALTWGVLAFILNFIPNIGSVIAAAPAVVIALLGESALTAIILGASYIAINMVVGNVLEPKLLGRRLGLSALVVFLSMVFWGWLWGTLGMFLSVPLTVVAKILCEHSKDLKWLAVILGPGIQEENQ